MASAAAVCYGHEKGFPHHDLRMPLLVSELMDPESSDAAAEEQDDDTSEGIDESSLDDMLLLWLFGWDLGF